VRDCASPRGASSCLGEEALASHRSTPSPRTNIAIERPMIEVWAPMNGEREIADGGRFAVALREVLCFDHLLSPLLRINA
jgi:hypothetical protein